MSGSKISSDAAQSPPQSSIKNASLSALPNSLKVTTNYNFVIDENAHVRNYENVRKSALSPSAGEHPHTTQPSPSQYVHQATTTTVTTKKIISVAPVQQVISNINQLNINQKNLRHSLSPSISSSADKQYFNPLNVNTQTHIYHHFYPTYPLQ